MSYTSFNLTTQDVITVFGGCGFIGRSLVKVLALTKCRINVITKQVVVHDDIITCGDVGQINIVRPKSWDVDSLEPIIKNSDYIVNLIGTIEKDFDIANIKIPSLIAKLAYLHNVKNFIHVSALLKVSKHLNSRYIESKITGEKQVLQNHKKAIVVKPSVIFGNNDQFLTPLINLIKLSPILPIWKSLATCVVQPVYVADLAEAICKLLFLKEEQIRELIGLDSSKKELCIEIAGPDKYSMLQILRMIMDYKLKRKFIMYIPEKLAILAIMISSKIFDNPTMNLERFKLLGINNITDKNHFKALGINPLTIEAFLKN